MKSIYKKYTTAIIFVLLICNSISASATQYIVWGTTVSLYTQSQVESSGHMIQSSKGILNDGPHPWCVNRMYVDFNDKALFATLLGAWLTGRAVNVLYDDASHGVLVTGHVNNLQCKVLSVF